MTAKRIRVHQHSQNFIYPQFDKLDGQHPWIDQVPNGRVLYQVRELQSGHISYFNFVLAKEMGLVPADHPHQMNAELEQKLIKTFSLQIINEYDELNNRRFNKGTIKPHKYMATRYLQLQHSNKRGATSGDGRGIWNGIISHRGKTWDVSSRGTGVTCLAPGAVSANKPLKTGGTEFGYGCGQAEIDELIASAISAEAMYLQGIPTERVLCIIDLGKGVGIGVRAAQNLIRPAHLFLYLKQNKYTELKQATDYFIERQIINKRWSFGYKDHRKYMELAAKVMNSFADFTAKLDIDYIFAWLDWDGDNVLADAGIIDYGSVRQFGIRHDNYRYDDVERFSTNLNEQRHKAQQIVQTFVQLCDFLATGQKRPFRDFAKHNLVQQFNKQFSKHRADRLLYRMGLSQAQREKILAEHWGLFDLFDQEFSWFEKAKISGKPVKVADGVNHPALYNMRNILKELPNYFQTSSQKFQDSYMPETTFFKFALSGFAKKIDTRIGKKQIHHIRNLQELYKEILIAAAGKSSVHSILPGIYTRSQSLNCERRITGNALVEIVDVVLKEKKKGLTPSDMQKLIDNLVLYHRDMPEVAVSHFYKKNLFPTAKTPALYLKLIDIVKENNETI